MKKFLLSSINFSMVTYWYSFPPSFALIQSISSYFCRISRNICDHITAPCLFEILFVRRQMSRLECLILTTVDLNQHVAPNGDMSVHQSTNPGDVRAIYVPLAIPSHLDQHYPSDVMTMSRLDCLIPESSDQQIPPTQL